MVPAPPRCRRRGCGHAFHKGGPCTAVDVTGPPSDHPATESHGDRVVKRCECPGFLR